MSKHELAEIILSVAEKLRQQPVQTNAALSCVFADSCDSTCKYAVNGR